jgi:hypothetical protein
MNKFKDLTGMKFGRLTVLYRDENNKEGRATWMCECSCENKTLKLVTGKQLLNGSIVSCGCKKKERKRNLINQIFGRWTVIERDNNSKKSKWICKCSCELNTIRSVDECNLINGSSQSCGCLNRKISSLRSNNPIGLKFNRLTVKYKYGVNDKGISLWYCECDCGGFNIVTYGNLNAEHVQSCGCLKNEVIHQRESNIYIKYDNFYKCYTLDGKEFEIDECDYNKVKDYCWYLTSKNYVATRINNKTLFIHKLIMDANDNQIIDHEDRDPTNNKRSNLRFATRSQNNVNIKIRKDNTSGVTGVSYRKDTNKWISRINFNKIRMELGAFDEFDDAVNARLEAEKKYHKEFTPIERRF